MNAKTSTASDAWHASLDKTGPTDDERIRDITPLPPPEHLVRFFPICGTAAEKVITGARRSIKHIMSGQDDRLLVVMGPCSIHDPAAALEYARRLLAQRQNYADTLEIVMRVYFEKPRTTVGWKGLINDPYLDETYRIDEGLRIARQLLVEINRLGLPAGSEFLDVISPQYIGDLISWGAIGARTTESQVHRELASGLSMPVGFKNGTDGNVKIAVDAVTASGHPHCFLSVTKQGLAAIVETKGNPDTHLILRGSTSGPNHDRASVAAACAALREAGQRPRLMVDCSHGNSGKDPRRQIDVARELGVRRAGGDAAVFGVMLESHLVEGRQAPGPRATLRFGQSVTDACLGWDDTEAVLDGLAGAVRMGRGQAAGPRAAG